MFGIIVLSHGQLLWLFAVAVSMLLSVGFLRPKKVTKKRKKTSLEKARVPFAKLSSEVEVDKRLRHLKRIQRDKERMKESLASAMIAFLPTIKRTRM